MSGAPAAILDDEVVLKTEARRTEEPRSLMIVELVINSHIPGLTTARLFLCDMCEGLTYMQLQLIILSDLGFHAHLQLQWHDREQHTEGAAWPSAVCSSCLGHLEAITPDCKEGNPQIKEY